jgi:hypothetical protein
MLLYYDKVEVRFVVAVFVVVVVVIAVGTYVQLASRIEPVR